MSNKLTIIYTFTAIEGKRTLFLEAARKSLEDIRKYPGCLHCVLSKNPVNSHEFTIIELWENEALWKKFLQSKIMADLSVVAGVSTMNWMIQKLYLCDM